MTLIRQTLADVLSVLAPGWQLAGAPDVFVRGVSVDSRQVPEGGMFVALRGEHRDGHDFIASAFAGGAALALSNRPVEGYTTLDTRGAPPESFSLPAVLVVDDPLTSMQALAGAHRARCGGLRVVAVTGSMGKTSVKEAIAAVLEQAGPTLKSAGNQNNEIGLPLTLFNLDGSQRYAVLEMGMYALGEIELLARLAQLHVGVVLNVAPIHLVRLGTIERIAQAKSELVCSLGADGVAILNNDDARVRAMNELTRARVLTYGLTPAADLWADQVRVHGLEGVSLVMHTDRQAFRQVRGTFNLNLQLLGSFAAYTALAAAAVGLSEGLGWEQIQAGMNSLGYGLRLVPEPGIRGITILNDAYNANPRSVMAALDVLKGLKGRRIAVLGDMLELAGEEATGHRAVGTHAAGSADVLLTLGEASLGMAEAAHAAGLREVHSYQNIDELRSALLELVTAGDFVLIKGSHSLGMERLVQALQEVPR
ncbi:MAG: UDP-N-acetylmuramoyl-tripeptide--D-alanyl-D-alanine ligase [Chloroflexi bacterium]|nr:UDP-N-acetylmuramoyl-tripeptide--D-alanyl-D-alanine ligase [Chloroflexota bacterium]